MIQADPDHLGLTVIGVADPDAESPGFALAQESGVELTVADYHDFFDRDDIDLVVELTGEPAVRDEVFRTLPENLHFIDHYASRFFWNLYDLAKESRQQLDHSAQRLRAQHQRLQDILDSLPYDVLVINKNFEVETANRTFLESNQLAAADVIGKYCYDIDHQTKPECDMSLGGCPHAETLKAGRSLSAVVSTLKSDGKEVFASVRTAPIRNESGEIQGIVEVVRDITSRVRMEESLQQTRERLSRFIDTAPLFIYMKDSNLRFRVINEHALQTLDLSEGEVVGQTSFAVFPGEQAHWLQSLESNVLKSGKTMRASGVLPVKGRDMHVSLTLFPVTQNDRSIGVFGMIEDTTELIESERKLLRSHEQLTETQSYLREVLENSRDLIFLTDTAGTLRSFNSGAEKSLGYRRDDVVRQPARKLFKKPSEFDELLTDALTEGHAAGYELEFRREDGTPVIANISLTAIDEFGGKPVEVVCICRDLTLRLRLQNDLARSERLAAIGKMAAGVAHEINNPLAVMDTIAGLVQDTIDEETETLHPATLDVLQNAVQRLRFQVRRCTNITHSLLGFVRKSESGKQLIDMEGLVEEALNLLAPEIQQSSAEIRRHIATDLPRICTDPMLLEQVLVNMIKNALDAIEEKPKCHGIVDIGAEVIDGVLELSIRDNGIGIPEDVREKIFDLFHTSKPAGKGTGLGLAIVMDIVKRLTAEIKVESEIGQWTRFKLLLPLDGTAC